MTQSDAKDKKADKTKEKKRKAIILCGGEGTRLRPLTFDTPKPLLTVGGTPVIVNIINMLKKHNITDIAMTTGYKGQDFESFITRNFEKDDGINLRFYYEQTPLGSAGGVKNAKDFLDCDFMVICGDAWCDFNPIPAFEKLEEKNCHAVIITTSTTSPLEYGLVMQDNDGKITAFSEKPSWSGVCSDTINTGIYLFKREILDLIPEGKYDFGRDLFADMLNKNMDIYSHNIDGSWCDIGDPETYYRCNMEMTGGSNYIAEGCKISAEAVVEKSILLDGTSVGRGSYIKGATIGRGCIIEENCKIRQGCVIGANSIVKEGCSLYPGVFLSENTTISKNSTVYNPLHGINLFLDRRMLFSRDIMTESFCISLGRALSIAMGENAKIGIMTDRSQVCEKISKAITDGLSAGTKPIYCLGKGCEWTAAFGARTKQLDLTIFIGELRNKNGGVDIKLNFFDQYGVYPGARFESKVKYGAKWTNSLDCKYKNRGITILVDRLDELYINSIIKECDAPISNMKIIFEGKSDIFLYVEKILNKYGDTHRSEKRVITLSANSKGGIDGITYDSIYFDCDHILCTVILYYINRGVREIPLPHRTPLAIKDFVIKNGARLSLYSLCCHELKETALKTCFCHLPALKDPCYALFSFIAYINSNNLSGQKLYSLLPRFSSLTDELYIPENLKQKIIDSNHHSKEGFFILDGEKIRLIPENSNLLSTCIEAADMEDARELIKKAKNYVESFIEKNT